MYTGIKDVRKNNSDQFIADFKKVAGFVIWSKYGGFYPVMKSDVWREAKRNEIFYSINDNLYVVKRNIMVIQ